MNRQRMGRSVPFGPRSLRWVGVGLAVLSAAAHAEGAIYRCGNEYTNNPTPAQKKECKLIEGGGVTVVPAATVRAAAAKPQPSSAQQPRVDPQQQQARDNDARLILEAELKKAEAKLAALQQEYNNGQPEKRGVELRNPAVYQERVSELKAALERAQTDVQGLRRELQRLGVANR